MNNWRSRAACIDCDPDVFFPRERKFTLRTWATARHICDSCPVRRECLAMALSVDASEDRWGMFGGMTPSERRQLRRRQMRDK